MAVQHEGRGQGDGATPSGPPSGRTPLAAIGPALRLDRLLPTLAAGLTNGLITLIFSLSFATLVFAGSLTPYLSRGVGIAFLGAIVLSVTAACGSSLPFAIAGPQSSVAVVVAVMAASLVGDRASSSPSHMLPTVLAAIALASLGMGGFFIGLGFFRLGRLIRFVPFPVVGGFLAGTGWLLLTGAARVLTGYPVGAATLGHLLRPDPLAHLLPGVALALALLVAARRYTHFLIMPALVLASAALFYAALALTNTPLPQAEAHGWLLGPVVAGRAYQSFAWGDLGRVDWSALAVQSGGLATAMVVGAVGLLLNVTGLEVATGRDLDVDCELRVLGVGNIVSGVAGGLGGFHQISLSLLARDAGATSQLVGLVTAVVPAVALAGGMALLADIPRFILGGLLLFVGLDFLVEWAYHAWFRLPRVEYAILMSILVVIALAGLLQGVLAGVGLCLHPPLRRVVWPRQRCAARALRRDLPQQCRPVAGAATHARHAGRPPIYSLASGLPLLRNRYRPARPDPRAHGRPGQTPRPVHHP